MSLNSYAPQWKGIGDGGLQIRKYETPLGAFPDIEKQMQIDFVLNFHQQKGRFPSKSELPWHKK